MALNIYSKESTDTLLAAKLDLAGGTMTGGLTLSASGIIFSDATYLTTAPAGSTLAADQLTAGVVTANPTSGPTATGDVLQYNGTDLVWAAGGGGGGVAWGAITGTVTDQTDLVTYVTGLGYQTASDVSTYVGSNAYPLTGNPSGFLTSVPGRSVSNYSSGGTLGSSDTNNVIYVSSGSSSTIYIPTDTTYNFPIGTDMLLVIDGSTSTTVTIYPEDNMTPSPVIVGTTYFLTTTVAHMVKVASNLWVIN